MWAFSILCSLKLLQLMTFSIRSFQKTFVISKIIIDISYWTSCCSICSWFVLSVPIDLSRNQCTIPWVSNYRYPVWTFWNWIPVIGCPHDFQVNDTLMASLAMFPYRKSDTGIFAQKKFSKDIFDSEIWYRNN